MPKSPFSSIPEVLDELRAGRMVVLTDDEDRENEGDLVIPAGAVTPEAITFMLSVARGYMCLSLTEADCDRLGLSPQAPINTSVRGTPMTVSIDGHPKHGFTTGVSAKERSETIRLALDQEPDNPAIMDSMGWILYLQGKPDDALNWLEQAYALMPDPEIAAHLGEVLWVTDERDEAIRIWTDALLKDPDSQVLNETTGRFMQ